MDCAECGILADQTSIARDEVEKIRERIIGAFSDAAFGDGPAPPRLIKALEAAERTHEKCMAAVERHQQSHQGASDHRLERSPATHLIS